MSYLTLSLILHVNTVQLQIYNTQIVLTMYKKIQDSKHYGNLRINVYNLNKYNYTKLSFVEIYYK